MQTKKASKSYCLIVYVYTLKLSAVVTIMSIKETKFYAHPYCLLSKKQDHFIMHSNAISKIQHY